ncbi:hypothetical protein VFPFJ_10787 [Purpureocillium lilacinum]|uniref:Uncharacterized protein n=1 Tax=Purpureocillium lilacinum TaxID=33203 RepID=A0A179GD93_PURLI|nr:hypothetical protein VFPFJ_10787 [Purpureocillium lilacinum]OAQ75797.1 hypothetical protein VFPFJ_10787 [Purpureocillium lilacinum]
MSLPLCLSSPSSSGPANLPRIMSGLVDRPTQALAWAGWSSRMWQYRTAPHQTAGFRRPDVPLRCPFGAAAVTYSGGLFGPGGRIAGNLTRAGRGAGGAARRVKCLQRQQAGTALAGWVARSLNRAGLSGRAWDHSGREEVAQMD